MSRKMHTTEEFIARAKAVHGDKYDYSKAVYTGTAKEIAIICRVHGDFKLKAAAHLQGSECKRCKRVQKMENKSSIIAPTKYTKKVTLDFLKKAKERYGDFYGYDRVRLQGTDVKIIITCPVHGDFERTRDAFLRGYECPECLWIANNLNSVKASD